MNCKEYQELSLPQKWEMVGKIVHLLQNDPFVFKEVAWIIHMGEQTGKFDDVKINPQTPKPNQ